MVHLDSVPHNIPSKILDLGTEVVISGMNGSQNVDNEKVEEPLPAGNYHAEVHLNGGDKVQCELSFIKESAKIWIEELN